jgi:type 1 glutamine amidotransferase
MAQTALKPRFRALVLAEVNGGHAKFDSVAKIWLNKLATDSNFTVDYISDTKSIDGKYLKNFQLFFQLDYPPYPWEKTAQEAFKKYIEKGQGGWVGLHHPTLLGEFDGFPMWQWYSKFMGDIKFENYIGGGATATLTVEDPLHPVMRNLPGKFTSRDQWYIYNKSPRPKVHVLASIDESSYLPPRATKMGDHPVIWTNGSVKARNIFIAMGHYPQLFNDTNYTALLRNALFWTVKKKKVPGP